MAIGRRVQLARKDTRRAPAGRNSPAVASVNGVSTIAGRLAHVPDTTIPDSQHLAVLPRASFGGASCGGSMRHEAQLMS